MTSAVPFKSLEEYIAQQRLLVAVDSDGSALDTMDVKYRQCFIPAVVQHFGLGGVAAAATHVAEFVFLNSRFRGLDRFRALVRILDLLAVHPDMVAVDFTPPGLKAFRHWIGSAERINEPSLAAAAAQADGCAGRELNQVLCWSRAIDAATQARVGDSPPFAGVREALTLAADEADVVVISSAPTAVVRAEWRKHDIDGYSRMLCGLEFGPKAELLSTLMTEHYGEGRVLMIGDSPGDRRAARTAGAWFYPIIAGREAESWRLFEEEVLGQFVSGAYTARVQERACMDFDAALPAEPPWTKGGFA